MEILCTRPGCPRPQNFFSDLDDLSNLKTAQQKYCTSCGMPLILAGRYIPSRLLGQGGFGAAFLARDRYTPTMRQCVVKQFQPSGNLSPQQLAIAQSLFEREAVVLETLGNQHPQIPNLWAFFPLIAPTARLGEEEQFFYLVQEFIDGKTLEEELAIKGHFSEREVRLVLEEMLKVLQFVHEQGSIHRDIKPSNVMRHQNGRLYLLDFGAVKQVTTGAANNPSARSTGIYSIGFAPPEQMGGSQVYPSTDLYALAATCINLLTGKAPEKLYDSYNNSWNWRSSAPNVSDRLAQILDRLLLPTPKDRFQSAADVLYALQNAPLGGQATAMQTIASPAPTPSSQPISNPPRPTSLPKRRPFSILEILGNAAFTGFEGTLLLFALQSLLPSAAIAIGVLGMVLGGLIFVQYRRFIEGKDLPILAIVSLAVMLFIPVLRGGWGIQSIIVITVLVTAGAVAITAFFRLIYQLLSRIL